MSSAKLPTSAPRPTTLPGRRWLNGPIVAPSSTVDDSTMLAQTRRPAPIVASTSWLPAPMTLPVADRRRAAQDDVRLEGDVRAEVDRPVEVDRRRVAHRHAVAHVRLVEPDAHAPLGRRELRAVVDPVEPAVVLEGDRADQAAVLAGEPDQLGQVQLAGRRPTASAPRSGGAARPRRRRRCPALISLLASSSGVASRASTIRSTVPNSPRTTRPSSAGSAANTLASAIAASSWRRASRTASRSAPVIERDVARQDEDLVGLGGDHGQRGRRPRRPSRAARPGGRTRPGRRRRR